MNVPGRPDGNWNWRSTEEMLSAAPFQWLRDLTESSNRKVSGAVS
jgi:4-alpha-glucanotransferase